ncbi:MAG: hypothetical protein ABJL07_12920, partial [Marinobacter sp.]
MQSESDDSSLEKDREELFHLVWSMPSEQCSGSMIPDTNVGGNIATISEVSDDQKTTIFYTRVQA